MRVVEVTWRGVKAYGGWFKERYGDHVAQVSTDSSLKLKQAVRDVARMLHRACAKCSRWDLGESDTCPNCCGASFGFVPEDVEQWCKRFVMPPMGVTDHHFVLGYDVEGEGWQQGSIETDEALKAYTEAYPADWAIVKEALGLARQKGRHACLPAGEGVMVVGGDRWPVDITQAGGHNAYTGQEHQKRGYSPNGKATLLSQGVRDVSEYILSTGKTIRCTPDHRVLTTAGWVPIQEAFDKGLDLVKSNVRIRLHKEDAENYAKARDGELLSWGGTASASSRWQCAQGHAWWAPLKRVYHYESWCRVCSHATRFTTRSGIDPKRQASKQLGTYRRHDKKHDRETTVTVETIMEARRSPCSYCGRLATGLERIDNGKGHTIENCAPCCLRCNWMRGRYTSHAVMVRVGALLKEIDP